MSYKQKGKNQCFSNFFKGISHRVYIYVCVCVCGWVRVNVSALQATVFVVVVAARRWKSVAVCVHEMPAEPV